VAGSGEESRCGQRGAEAAEPAGGASGVPAELEGQMMGFFFAWAVGEGFIVWRWVKNGAPPTPGALLVPSALYLGLAVLAEYAPARGVATAFAWSVDAAVALQVIGKPPGQATGWPPLCIPSGQFMPKTGAGVPCVASSGASNSGVTQGIGGPAAPVLPPAVPGAPNINPSQGGGTRATLV
jgi:hypothetical protein